VGAHASVPVRLDRPRAQAHSESMPETKQLVTLKKKPSGVAVLLLDCPGRVNLLTAEVMYEFGRALDWVSQDASLRALVLVSGKPDTFLSGADLHEIIKVRDQEAAYQMSKQGQAVLNKLLTLGKPTVVGINGVCLGGGLELALCCSRRIATTDPRTLLGLPEVKLGLLPGLGGTQRLPRLIGLRAALELILSGDPIPAQRAREIGLVDELAHPDDLLTRLEQLALELVAGHSGKAGGGDGEWSQQSGGPDPKQGALFAMAERSVRIKTKGHYPAHTRVLDVMREGLTQGMAIGLEMEARAFGELSVSEVCRNLIFLFFSTEFAKQAAGALAERAEVGRVATVGVVGGGTMGATVARLMAMSGHKVLFRVGNITPAEQAMEKVRSLLQRDSQKSKDSDKELEALLERIVPITSNEPLADADLIVEAVSEDFGIKSGIFGKLSSVVKPDCVLATNTSALSISQLALAVKENGRFLGLHFFHPVDKMPLVEIISHKGTRREVLARAAGFISRLGKTPVVVADGPGFLVNRLLCVYLLEAARLAESGIPLNWIEEAAIDFGMPMGPLSLLDEVGLDIAFKVADALYKGCGERLTPPVVLEKVKAIGLVGKKTGTGIYSWDESGKRKDFDPRLTKDIGLVVSDQRPDQETLSWISERLVLPMVDEAARCLEERVVRRAREVDLSMALGIGFPPFRGGPLRYADSIGMAELRERLERIYQESGPRRHVSELLRKMESTGRRFYSRAGDAND